MRANACTCAQSASFVDMLQRRACAPMARASQRVRVRVHARVLSPNDPNRSSTRAADADNIDAAFFLRTDTPERCLTPCLIIHNDADFIELTDGDVSYAEDDSDARRAVARCGKRCRKEEVKCEHAQKGVRRGKNAGAENGSVCAQLRKTRA